MNGPLLSLPAQGLVGLVLALICGTLYVQRRRSCFFFWALSWSCFSLWALLGDLPLSAAADGTAASWARWVRGAAGVCVGWHAVLWVFGLGRYRHNRDRARRAPAEGGSATAAAAGFSRFRVLVLLGVTAGSAFAIAMLPRSAGATLAAVGLAGVYGGSAVLLLHDRRRAGGSATRLLALALVFATLGQVLAAAAETAGWVTGSAPVFGGVARAVEVLGPALLAAGLVGGFANGEHDALRSAQCRLAESEHHFRLVFEQSGVGMALLAPDGRFLQVNAALARLLGYDPAALVGHRLVDFAHPDDTRHGISPSEQGLNLPSDLYERERRYLRRDGGTVWARVLRVPLRDAAGELRYLVGVFIDITERRRAEEALAASEQRYRLRFQGAFDGLFCCTEAGDLFDTNPAFCRMIGYTPDELRGLALADLTDDLPRLRRYMAAVLGRGGEIFESRLRRKDGSTVDVEISGAAIDLEGRRIVHNITRDVSERKRAEEALREEQTFSTQVLETADALILVLDPAGRIVRFNGTCAALSGYREDEVRGRVFWEFLVPAAWAEAVRENFVRLMAEQAPVAFECPWTSRAGGERWVAWRYSTAPDAPGRPRYAIGTGLDVTERRQLEEQLRQAQKMETLGTLVGGIAHDFNNLLTVSVGNVALLEQHPDLAGRQELADADEAARRCADMTQSLLTFGRRRIGRPQVLDLNPVVAEAVRLLQRLLPAAVRVEVGAEAQPWPVNGDRTQLHQVLMNLAVNARDAMPEGGTLRFTTANTLLDAAECARNVEARPGRFLVIAVEDTGSGMSADVRDRIFEPFFTTKPVGQGTGLGLSVVYGIVKAHRGWITVASRPGQGSTFRVYLPAAEVEVGAAAGGAPPAVRGGHECILVVDDEEKVRNLTRCVLERWGFRVLAAADGDEALTIYRERTPEIDLVLLDFTMPGLTGLQVMRRLRDLNPAVRVVFASGHTGQPDDDSLLAAGAHGLVPKPYRPEELVRRVRQILDNPAPP